MVPMKKTEIIVLVIAIIVFFLSVGWLMHSCEKAAEEIDRVGLKKILSDTWEGQGQEDQINKD